MLIDIRGNRFLERLNGLRENHTEQSSTRRSEAIEARPQQQGTLLKTNRLQELKFLYILFKIYSKI